MPGILPENYAAWEIDPSTRQSVHIWTKRAPVDVTLATPGTAQNLYLVAPGIPTVNLITNPSFETGDPPTGFTAAGATLAQSAVVARTGSFSMSVDPDNAAAGEGGYWTLPSLGSGKTPTIYLVVSAYFHDNVGSGNGARVVIADSNGTPLVNGNTVALAAAWARSVAVFPLVAQAAVYRIYYVTALQHNTTFYVDSAQAELRMGSSVTDYCDGSLGMNYFWDGVAHASVSRRRRGISTIRGYRLHCTRDVYFAEDQVATSSTGEYKRAGTDFWTDFPLDVRTRLSILNVLSGEQPRVYGMVWGVHEG